jgi:hypothetical protein
MMDPDTYLSHLQAYMNREYVIHDGAEGFVVLKEKYFKEGETRARLREIKLLIPGRGIAIKLDQDDFESSQKKNKPALFHFLDDTAKPWSKRCDFVVVYIYKKVLCADCIEFKSKSLSAEKIVPQLRAGVNWVKSLKRTIENYTDDSRKIRVRKFVFAENPSPASYLDQWNQLSADPSVRYYHFEEVNGKSLIHLENRSFQEI